MHVLPAHRVHDEIKQCKLKNIMFYLTLTEKRKQNNMFVAAVLNSLFFVALATVIRLYLFLHHVYKRPTRVFVLSGNHKMMKFNPIAKE